MAFTLAPQAAAGGYRLAAFETIGSTSAEVMVRARGGERGPLWVVSSHQTSGRGRRGSDWQTPPGNLAASLLLTTDLPPAVIANLGFVAGVALVRALEQLTRPASAIPSPLAGEEPAPGLIRGGLRASEGRTRDSGPTDPSSVVASRRHLLPPGEKEAPRFTLKWPNDVLVNGAKLAGILLETEETSRGRALVIGIGVNVAHAPGDLPYRTGSLAALGLDITAEHLFNNLTASWVELERIWDRGTNFAAIRTHWLARAAGLGGAVRVASAGTVHEGTFETIDEDGQLVLRASEGMMRRISAGDVHFGQAATLRPGAAA